MPKPHGLQTLPVLEGDAPREAGVSPQAGPASVAKPVVSVHDPRTFALRARVQRPNPSLRATQAAVAVQAKRKEH